MRSILFTLACIICCGSSLLADEDLIVGGGASHPTISPDGIRMAYKSQGDQSIHVRSLINQSDFQLSQTIGSCYEPDWSKSGELILFRSYDSTLGTYLATVNAQTGQVNVISSSNLIDDGAVWSYSGAEIAFQTSAGLAIMGYPGGGISMIPCGDPDGTECEGEEPTWSPDDQWIAFEDGIEILKVPRTGGLANVVVATGIDVSYPVWSPDGRWIAFLMQEEGCYLNEFYNCSHIWVADSRGTGYGLWQLTSGSFSDGNPAWSPDGAYIYFNRMSEGSFESEIWRVSTELLPCGDIGFRPTPHGWGFANSTPAMWPADWWPRFDYTVPPYPPDWQTWARSSDYPPWESIVDAFGTAQCYKPSGEQSEAATKFWRSVKKDFGGACFGFAITAGLFFDGMISHQTYIPCLDVSSCRMLINEYFCHQWGKSHLDYFESHWQTSPSQTALECREMFTDPSPNRNDRILLLESPETPNTNGSSKWIMHAVNPYRCSTDVVNPEITYIYFYESGAPGSETRRIKINTSEEWWQYDGIPGWGWNRGLYLSDQLSTYTVAPILSTVSKASNFVTVYSTNAAQFDLSSAYGGIGNTSDSVYCSLTLEYLSYP